MGRWSDDEEDALLRADPKSPSEQALADLARLVESGAIRVPSPRPPPRPHWQTHVFVRLVGDVRAEEVCTVRAQAVRPFSPCGFIDFESDVLTVDDVTLVGFFANAVTQFPPLMRSTPLGSFMHHPLGSGWVTTPRYVVEVELQLRAARAGQFRLKVMGLVPRRIEDPTSEALDLTVPTP